MFSVSCIIFYLLKFNVLNITVFVVSVTVPPLKPNLLVLFLVFTDLPSANAPSMWHRVLPVSIAPVVVVKYEK